VVVGGTGNAVSGAGAVAAAGQFNVVDDIEAMSAWGRSNRVP
jgi:hypothetical protein